MISKKIVWAMLRGISDGRERWQSLRGNDSLASFQSSSTLEELISSKLLILLVVSL